MATLKAALKEAIAAVGSSVSLNKLDESQAALMVTKIDRGQKYFARHRGAKNFNLKTQRFASGEYDKIMTRS
jgi:hypothetical protein